ncbi:MAG: crossover junction endodeoxyribonuclease RuvC [Candidatus Pelethousia sp.]|nr:crossover junction endodeoxyribonuclease RuvC [Candidatus Pelethousia sp.]
MIILGIDPGYAILGYGVLETNPGRQPRPVDYGVIETAADEPFPQRLEKLHLGVRQLIGLYKPDQVAFEELFFCRNVTTALQVGAGRGVALLAAQQAGIPLYEYTPMQIKLAVCGNGHADKRQIQQMVKLLLGLRELPRPDDAADALGAAICHANTAGPAVEEFRIR